MLPRGWSPASDATSTSHRHCVTLHWLPISQRITFKIALMIFDCSRGRYQKYFGDVYTPVHTAAARSRLWSADHGDIASSYAFGSLRLAAAVSACADQQFGTNFDHRICKARTLGNSLNVVLRTGYLSVRMEEGVSNRHWQGAPYKWTYLLTYAWFSALYKYSYLLTYLLTYLLRRGRHNKVCMQLKLCCQFVTYSWTFSALILITHQYQCHIHLLGSFYDN